MSTTVWCDADFNYIDLPPVRQQVHDGRQQSPGRWQDAGFELVTMPSAVTDWESDDEVSTVHYQEVRELAQQLTGCDFVVLENHIRRGPKQAAIHPDLGPINFVHSDFAASYDALIRRHHSELRDSDTNGDISAENIASAKDLVILQFWRNIGAAKMDTPLAFCDARTVPAQDLLAINVTNYAGEGFDFEALAIRPAPASRQHSWFAFPEMRQDEAVVFRTYDSRRRDSGQPFWTPHSAFRDPDVSSGNPARESIELRALCFFTGA